MCFPGTEQWEIVAEKQDCRAARMLDIEPGSTMTGPPLESGRALVSEPALSCDPEMEEVCLNMSPPGTRSLIVEQKGSTPTDAQLAEDRVVAEDPAGGMKASVQTQCMDLESMEEDLSHNRTAWAEERAPEQPSVSPKEPLAACCPGEGCLPSTAPVEEEDVELAPLPREGDSYSIKAEQELPSVENTVEMEHSCLLETRAWALSRGEVGAVTQSCCIQAEDDSVDEQECPICTELYDQDKRKPALLNCSHVLCGQCLRSIMEASSAADIGRVRCPICRQKTPMMEWEICKLQEELLLMNTEESPAVAPPIFTALPARRPGVWGSLEHHFQVRFHTTRMVGFLPCLRYPPSLIRRLARLERRCRWCYRFVLVGLFIAEMLSLLLVFLPIVLLLLLFLILDK